MSLNGSVGFLAVSGLRPRVLILGTLPSVQSLATKQYYGNPRNAFWLIIERLAGKKFSGPYSEKIETVKRLGIALWDVYCSAPREGSLDSSIVKSAAVINDLSTYLAGESVVQLVACNGASAYNAFVKAYDLEELEGKGISVVKLPSTSPAHAAMPFDDKWSAWNAAISPLLRA